MRPRFAGDDPETHRPLRPDMLDEADVAALPFDPPLWWNRSDATRRVFTRAVRQWEASGRKMPPPTHQQWLRDRRGVMYREAVALEDPEARRQAMERITHEWQLVAGHPPRRRADDPRPAPPEPGEDVRAWLAMSAPPAVEDWFKAAPTPVADDPVVPL